MTDLVIDIIVSAAIITPSVLALYLWYQLGELRERIADLQVECDGLTGEIKGLTSEIEEAAGHVDVAGAGADGDGARRLRHRRRAAEHGATDSTETDPFPCPRR